MNKINKEALSIAKYIHTFLNEYVPSQKSSSEHTLKSYKYAIFLYIDFLETIKKITPKKFCAANFDGDIIEQWLKWLSENRGCSAGTCNNRLASLRVFLKYLGKMDISMLYLHDVASNIPRRKEPHRKVSGMSKEAVQALMSAPDVSTVAGRRDLALIIVMYSTAARIDEILSMKIEHLHLDVKKPYVNVIGKGNKIRTLYLLPKAVAHLKAYIKECHGVIPDSNAYVFYSRNTGQYSKLSQTAINKRLKQHATTARQQCPDVPLDMHAHKLRHAKASHWLGDGMNIVQISFLLGHEQLETTMVYTDITTDMESKALATLESENDKNTQKKWKTDNKSLSNFFGIK